MRLVMAGGYDRAQLLLRRLGHPENCEHGSAWVRILEPLCHLLDPYGDMQESVRESLLVLSACTHRIILKKCNRNHTWAAHTTIKACHAPPCAADANMRWRDTATPRNGMLSKK